MFSLIFVDVAEKIIDLAVNGKAQNESYNRLANFTDKFGSRIAGLENLENAIGMSFLEFDWAAPWTSG